MRKSAIFFLLLSLIAITGCSESPGKAPYLTLVSNVSGIRGQSSELNTLPEGDPSIGLLINFGNTSGSGIADYDENTFYVFYLQTGGEDDAGNRYNYALYVPEIIRDVYIAGNGDMKYHENPFRWYIEEYLGLNADTAAANPDWMLDTLIGQAGRNLPYPEAADISNTWKEYEYWNLPDDVSFVADDSVSLLREDRTPHSFQGTISGLFLSSQENGPFAEAGKEYEKVVSNAFYITRNGKLFYPAILSKAYESATGEYLLNGNPFWAYLRAYFGITLQDVEKEGFQLALNALLEADSLPMPDPADYTFL